MKLKAQNAVVSIEDLDILLDLSTDDALSIALDHASNQELEPEWYDELASKLGDTQQAAFTSGLVDKGIRVMSKKQAQWQEYEEPEIVEEKEFPALKLTYFYGGDAVFLNRFTNALQNKLENFGASVVTQNYTSKMHTLNIYNVTPEVEREIKHFLSSWDLSDKAELDYYDEKLMPSSLQDRWRTGKKANSTLTKLKNHFIALANEQGCLYEDDYHAACHDITDSRLIGDINTWILSAGLQLKKNKPKAESDYKKKVRDVAKHPNINKLTNKSAKKKEIEKPEVKKSFPDKMPESDLVQKKTDYPPLYGLNKVIKELKDKEFKTEFLPPWNKKEAQADDDWATDEAERWLLNDEGLYNESIYLATHSGGYLDDGLRDLLMGAGVMEESDLAAVNWDALALSVSEWEEVTGGLEEEGAVGQEINMYDDGHFPIGGNKEAQQRGKCIHCGEIFVPYDPGSGQLITDECPICKDLMKQKEVEDLEEEACLDPGRKERSKGKGRGLGKGKGKGPLGVPIGEKRSRYITKSELREIGEDPKSIEKAKENLVDEKGRKIAQQQAPFGESDLDEFFESELEFEQAPKPEYTGDIDKFQRIQELQAKQAQGMLTPDEEIELSALAEELGPMMPGLAKK